VLISNAYAQAATESAGGMGDLMQFMPIILMFAVMYFLMIRPQQKKAKEHKAMIDGLSKGDEVVSQGGVAGRITKVNEDFVTVEVADNVEIQIQKPAIALVLPKGTLKAL